MNQPVDTAPQAGHSPLNDTWTPDTRMGDLLKGRRGLVVGIANEHSIAYGCASKLRSFGAELAITHQNDKARPDVEPLEKPLGAAMLLPLDVTQPGAIANVFTAIREQWSEIDFVIHSIAFTPRTDLHGRIVDCSREGFLMAMQVSCHSFSELAHHAESMMRPGGALVTMSSRLRQGGAELQPDGSGQSRA